MLNKLHKRVRKVVDPTFAVSFELSANLNVFYNSELTPSSILQEVSTRYSDKLLGFFVTIPIIL